MASTEWFGDVRPVETFLVKFMDFHAGCILPRSLGLLLVKVLSGGQQKDSNVLCRQCNGLVDVLKGPKADEPKGHGTVLAERRHEGHVSALLAWSSVSEGLACDLNLTVW